MLFLASEWVTRELEVYLVPWTRDIWTRYFRTPESAEGDVGGEDHQEQDHHLRAGVGYDCIDIIQILIDLLISVQISPWYCTSWYL